MKSKKLTIVRDSYHFPQFPATSKDPKVRSGKLVPWHSNLQLAPWERMVQDLFLMAVVLRRDWMDDTSLAESKELNQIAAQIRRIAKRLHRAYAK
jgi:hypothetical protein